MNTSKHEPFDNEEAALARALRGLPNIEPPPELDARVLAMAKSALPKAALAQSAAPKVAAPAAAAPAPVPAPAIESATNRTPRRRPWFGAGFGAIAASVFAAVIGIRMGWFDGSLPGESTVPASSMPESDAAPAARQEQERFDVDFIPAPEPAPVPPPPPTADAQSVAAPAPAAAASRSVAPAAKKTAPEAQRAVVAPAPPPMPAPAPTVPMREYDEKPRESGGSAPEPAAPVTIPPSLQSAPDTVLSPWREDAAFPVNVWLERIRARVAAGDRQGAAQSLRLLRRQHPGIAVPPDLKPLLAQ